MTIDATLTALEDALDFCADEPVTLDRTSLVTIWREIIESEPASNPDRGRWTVDECTDDQMREFLAHAYPNKTPAEIAALLRAQIAEVNVGLKGLEQGLRIVEG